MRKFLLGSDWWTDCDDAVALRLLCRAARSGQIQLLGIGINACMEHSAASMTAFLKLEGMEGIPLGLDRKATDFGGNPPYQARLAARCPEITNHHLPDAAALYEQILTEADEPIEILEIGYPQVIAAVLAKNPSLFCQKVKKVWMMAGKWDGDGQRENNFCRNRRASEAAEAFCRLCPVPVTFLGWEIGASVITGSRLTADDPLHLALADHGSANGRSSWDPMLVLLALTGDEAAAGYDTVTGFASVDAETGANHFHPDPAGPHRYVIKKHPDEFYRDAIDRLL